MTLSPEALVKIGQPVASGANALDRLHETAEAPRCRGRRAAGPAGGARPSLVVQSSTSARAAGFSRVDGTGLQQSREPAAAWS